MKSPVILVSNANSPDHAASIRALFDGADDIRIAVAFLKRAGAEFIVPILERQLIAGATVDVFVGTDFFHTDPCALKKLLALKLRPDF